MDYLKIFSYFLPNRYTFPAPLPFPPTHIFYLICTHFLPPFPSHLLTFSTLFARISCPPPLPTYSHFYLICTYFLPPFPYNLLTLYTLFAHISWLTYLTFLSIFQAQLMSGSSERPKLYLLCVNSSTFCPIPVFTFPSIFRFINN